MDKSKFKKYIATCLALVAGYAIFGDIGLLIGLAVLFVWS